MQECSIVEGFTAAKEMGSFKRSMFPRLEDGKDLALLAEERLSIFPVVRANFHCTNTFTHRKAQNTLESP